MGFAKPAENLPIGQEVVNRGTSESQDPQIVCILPVLPSSKVPVSQGHVRKRARVMLVSRRCSITCEFICAVDGVRLAPSQNGRQLPPNLPVSRGPTHSIILDRASEIAIRHPDNMDP
jgi:hypothetical protein